MTGTSKSILKSQADSTNCKTRFGTYSTSEAIIAGLDLEMPGKTRWRGGNLIHAIWSRVVPEHILDERVRNVLNLINFKDKSGIPENGRRKSLIEKKTANFYERPQRTQLCC